MEIDWNKSELISNAAAFTRLKGKTIERES